MPGHDVIQYTFLKVMQDEMKEDICDESIIESHTVHIPKNPKYKQ